jgi:signal transduction histidine kinase
VPALACRASGPGVAWAVVDSERQDRRLRDLFDASLALSSELSLDALLQKVVETAARLTDARYAALGVLDTAGDALERFITTGMDEEQRATIGELPRGRGILGVLIREPRPLRLASLGDDPRSVGFPAGHPPMSSFLGVPLALRGVSYGNVYLTEKSGGEEFTVEDEEIVTLLAAQAAVMIENARLYESSTRWSRQLESLHEIVRSIVDEIELDKLLQLVCARVRELTQARVALVALAKADGSVAVSAIEGVDGDVGTLLGRRFDVESKLARVLQKGHSARVDSLLEDPDVHPEEAHELGARTGLYVPLISGRRKLGVIAVHDKLTPTLRFSDADERVLEIFASRAAVAVSLSQRVAQETVRRVIQAQESERKHLARELHDETGQALTSILLGLGTIRAAKSAEAAERAEAEVRELVVQALQDVRRLAVELRPAVLDDFGLAPALARLAATFAERTGVVTDVETRLEQRLPAEIETALYRLVQEALTNVVKHAKARHVSIIVGARPGRVVVTVDDDGQGFVEAEVESSSLGLLGMRERLALLGGSLEIESSLAGGTTLSAQVPLSAGA